MESIITSFISGIAVGLSIALIANGFKKNITNLHFTIDATGVKPNNDQEAQVSDTTKV